MKVLICNERFLFRFGLDRVLILLAKGLADRGHEIYMMSAQWDEAVVGPLAKRFIPLPGPADYAQFNEAVADWLRREWNSLFTPSTRPDVVLIGGWPFFAAIEVFAEVCSAVVFVEPGAVPLDGFDEGGLAIQKILRDHRAAYLPKATGACPISQFLAETQTVMDGVAPEQIKTILLGADHMEQVLWENQRLKAAAATPTTLTQKTKHWLQRHLRPQPPTALARVEQLLAKDRHLILNLGRWEANCYKNSESCIELARQLRQDYPDVVLIALADPDKLVVPDDVRHSLVAIGFPDDQELQTIMQKVQLGISVSQWEGFNLPLAEMQWIEQPALVFNLGAHREVVVHPWFLCSDAAEMLEKIRVVLEGQIPEVAIQPEGYKKWRSFFNWQRVVDEYEQHLQGLLAQSPAPRRRMGTGLPLLIIDVTNSCRDPANSGVVRVTRQLSRQIQQRLDPLFVVWDFDRQEYVLPSPAGYRYLQQFNGPQMPMIVQDYIQAGTPPPTLDRFLAQQLELADRPRVFLFAETILDSRCQASQAYVQQRGWESAAILYDLIPMLYPEYCSNGVKSFFEVYLKLVAEVDDAIGISEFSVQCFRDYCDKNELTPGKVSAIMLPGEFGKHQRHTRSNPDPDCLKLLCVSTLEPRKNHRSLIKACAILSQQYPEVKWELTLVGNSYTGAPEIKQAIEGLAAQDSRVQWLGIVDDAQLHQLYHEAHVTVYSSLVEGFGMPILESIWHGRPCLCHHAGVMAELAAQTPGCVALDMTDPESIAAQIVHLAQNPTTIANLTEAACHASLKTWNNYVDEIFHLLDLKELPAMNNALAATRNTWQEILYPICDMPNWQMHDSERMALTGLLARHQPACSIEIGTYYGGSLTLIAEHSEMVFSIDIDPEVGSRFPKPDNVSLFTGPSTAVFPQLMETLAAEDVAVDFILIDGDHSSEGVRRDINLVLSYVPKKTTLVVMHDSFNPGCRQGMLEADWVNCSHVLWVDLDFVPGRVIESTSDNPFGGEMWGGLALAILSPERRSGDLAVLQSARTSFDLALNTRS
jgi:glycosyltransferase involved in cell wall biosynthesis/predicted O-methyltransferase YrrM